MPGNEQRVLLLSWSHACRYRSTSNTQEPCTGKKLREGRLLNIGACAFKESL